MITHVANRVQGRVVGSLAATSLALLLALALLTPMIEMSGLLSNEQKMYRVYLYALLLICQLALLCFRGVKRTIPAISSMSIMVVFWCFVSAIWSDNVALTLRRSLLLAIVYLVTYGSMADLGFRRSIALLRGVLVAALFINIIVVIVFPEIGTQSWNNREVWRGFMAHKNIAGMLCAVTIITFSFNAGKIILPFRVSIILLSSAFLFMTWSRTSMIATLVSVLIGLFARQISRSVSSDSANGKANAAFMAWTFLGLLTATILFLTLERDIIVSFTDDASSVSQRNAIWRPLIQDYLDRPLSGSGYGAYWDISLNNKYPGAFKTQRWLGKVDQAHNGYLDLLVQLGAPGLLMGVYAALIWPLTRLSRICSQRDDRGILIISVITFVMLSNLTESSLYADDSLLNVFLLIMLAQIHQLALNGRSGSSREARVQKVTFSS